MDHNEENLDERQEDEVEALKSIYDCDFDDLRKHDGVVHQILSPISNSESTKIYYDFFFNWQTVKKTPSSSKFNRKDINFK